MRNSSLLVASLSLLACGGSVDATSQSSGGTTSGSSSSGASSSSSSSSGASSSSSSSSGAGGASSSSSSSSGAGGGPCSGYLDIAADNGAAKHYASICQNSWGSNETTTALGYEFSGGPAPGVQRLNLVGCVGPGANSEGIDISMDKATTPGTFTVGTVSWTDQNGATWVSGNFAPKVTITKLDPVGGVIEGSVGGMVSQGGNAAHTLNGTFHVCRVNDELAP
jgi:hypothetical protein